ncbi:MAG: arginine N-succinyltransferase, partial [Parvularcula sp.]|nr:arginine N-succinyltransferase [Parvularcula sp.]
AISERIAQSQGAIAKQERAGPHDIFFFVLEHEGQVQGMASIFPALGEDRPFYSYRMSNVAAAAPELDVRAESGILYLCNDFHGYTEIGTLLVSDKMRGTGAGRLLSLSRFLFMKTVEERLSPNVMAEIRGAFDENDDSPFWNAVASKFFHMSFEEADRRSAQDFRFIADLMPKFPIYTTLLPEDAQEVIGKPHRQSAPAMNMLMNEGFQYTKCVDIFDAGPSLEAPLRQIRTVREATTAIVRIQEATPADTGQRYIVAVPEAERFRCSLLLHAPRDGSLFLTPAQADALGVGSGEQLLVSPLKSARTRP